MPIMTDAKNVAKFVWSHPANDGQRIRALQRAAGFQVRSRLLRKRSVAQLGRRSMVWADLHRTSASKVVYANPPDYPEMLIWQQNLHLGDLFVDVGANIGSYAIWAAELGADVIALEPALDTFSLLVENVALNDYPITALRLAAAANSGTARFTSGQDSGNHLDPAGNVEITTATIDSIIGDRTVAGMKVDVEGFEIDVLRGCAQALSQGRIKMMQLEWNAASLPAVGTDRLPIADLLCGYRYSLYRPDQRGVLVPVTDISYGSDIFAVSGRP